MRRLLREFNASKKLFDSARIRGEVNIEDENIFIWNVRLKGLEDTPWNGKDILFQILFPPEYPLQAPEVFLDSFIIHPNLTKGKVCLKLLSEWKVDYNPSLIIDFINNLIQHPDPYNPHDSNIANLYINDIERFNYLASSN